MILNGRLNILKIIFILILGLTSMSMKAGAYIPVTYTCCYNYTYDDGVLLNGFENPDSSGIQLDNFENLSNWKVGGIGASQRADTVNFKEGKQGLELIATNGSRAYTIEVINNSFSTVNNFEIWIYVHNSNTLSFGNLYFTSTGNAWSKYFITHIRLHQGWNKIILDKNNFINNGGESWNNVMNRLEIAIYPTSGKDTNVTIGDLRYNVTNDWILGAGSSQPDPINYKEGQQGLKLIATNGSPAYMSLSINNDFSTTNNFAVWIYIDNATNQIGVTMYFTSNATFNKFFSDSEWSGVKSGWNELIFSKNNFKNTGGENWNNIIMVRLRIYPSAGANLNVTFDDLRYNVTGQRAKLMIEFDDGDKSAYSKVYPILSANNQPGVSFVVTSFVGSDEYNMNLTNLRTLQDAGWDISSHTVDHPYLARANDSALTSELNDSYDWLVANNFQKSAGFIAYPYGSFNDAVIDKAKKRYVLGRSTQPESVQQHFVPTDDAIRYIQRIIQVLNTTSVQSIKDQINDSINSKLLGILVFHDIVDIYDCKSGTMCTYQYSATDLQTISDYIKSRNADVDVITYSDYVVPNINNFTPVINKTTRIYSNGTVELITKNKYDEYMPNMTVKPYKGSIDINIGKYQENGDILFSESGSDSSTYVQYSVGDRIPGKKYLVRIYWSNETVFKSFYVIANNTGYINYYSTGIDIPRYTEIRQLTATDNVSEYNDIVPKMSPIITATIISPTVTATIPKASGFEIFTSILLLFIFGKYKRNKK